MPCALLRVDRTNHVEEEFFRKDSLVRFSFLNAVRNFQRLTRFIDLQILRSLVFCGFWIPRSMYRFMKSIDFI